MPYFSFHAESNMVVKFQVVLVCLGVCCPEPCGIGSGSVGLFGGRDAMGCERLLSSRRFQSMKEARNTTITYKLEPGK
jgi:hypothetical protein